MNENSASPITNPANSPSKRFFREIGIENGMRVLDVGCGAGDLARLAATLAGSDGDVVGIDRSSSAVETARAHPSENNAAPIRYKHADLSQPTTLDGSYDAIIGRRVLMYLPDPEAILSGLIELARPKAIIAFQEHARSNLPASLGHLPHHKKLYDWVWDTVAAEGADVKLAFRLVDVFKRLQLHSVSCRSEAIVLQAGDPSFLPKLAEVMQPRIIEQGVADTQEIDLASLKQQLEVERDDIGGSIIWDIAFLICGNTAAE